MLVDVCKLFVGELLLSLGNVVIVNGVVELMSLVGECFSFWVCDFLLG